MKFFYAENSAHVFGNVCISKLMNKRIVIKVHSVSAYEI